MTTSVSRVGTEIRVNTATANDQIDPQITALSNGGFVVTWNDASLGVGGATGDTINYAVKAQVFAAGGAPVGTEILINTATYSDQFAPQITALSNGGFVVTWQDDSRGVGGATGDTNNYAVKAQVFAAGGAPVGSEIRVNTATASQQSDPHITALSNGGFVVTWTDYSQGVGGATGDTSGAAVKAQLFAAGGAPVGAEIRVNTATAGDQFASQTTALSNGGFVVTWNDYSVGVGGATGDTSFSAVKAQVFAAGGAPVGSEIRVNTATAFQQSDPQITALSNGGFVVTWNDRSQGVGGATGDTSAYAVKAQVFAAGGAPVGTEIRVNTATSSDQYIPKITALSNGGFVVTWNDSSQGVGGATGDTSSTAIKAQIFAAGGAPVGSEIRVNTATSSAQGEPQITALSNGGFVVTWNDYSQGVGGATGDTSSYAVKAQVFAAAGAPVGTEILVNTATSDEQLNPQITALSNGGFVVTWKDYSQGVGGATGDTSGYAVKAQVFAVTTVNDAPTLSAMAAVVDTTNEDTQAQITFAEIAAQGNEADVDGTVTAFVVKAVTSGTLLIGTSAGTATAFAVGTNDIIDATHHAYWTGAQDANGTLNAFTVVAKDDGGAESTTPVQVQVGVAAVNDAPTLSAMAAVVDTTNEDTQAQITFAEIAAQGNEADVDGTVTAFVVKAVTSGTLLIGTSLGTATAFAVGTNDIIDATHHAYWTGAQDANGTLNAFTVVAKDDGGAESATPVQVQVGVTALNDAPTLTAMAVAVDTTDEDTQAQITFAEIAAQGNEADVDGTVTAFVVKAVTSGTLLIGTSLGTAMAFAVGTNDIIDATHHAYWIGAQDANGTLNAFTVVAKDDGGAESATPVQVQVRVAAVNDAPTLSAMAVAVDTTDEDTQAQITFAEIAAQGNQADVDGTVTAFVVKAVTSGTLLIGTSLGTATAFAVGTNDIVDATHHAYWTGVQDANGTLNAFTVVDKDDGGAESATPVQVQVGVTAVNDAPTLTTMTAVVDTTNEDTQAQITFAEIAAQGDQADVDGTVTAFVVKAVTSGTLLIGTSLGAATAFAVGTNDIIDATHHAYWTGAQDANGTLNAFTVVAKDDGGAESATPVQVQIGVTAVNDAPVANADTLAATEDVAIDYTAADLIGNDSDVDGNPLTIASVTSGVGGTAVLNGDGTVTFTPTANFNGAASFTYTVQDNQGSTSAPATVTINVAAVNDAPVNSIGTVHTTITGRNLAMTALAIADVDAASASVTTTLHVDHGVIALTVNGGANLTGNNSASVTLTGTVAQINAALSAANNVIYYSDRNYTGQDRLTLTTSDNGGTGAGGPMTDVDVVGINVLSSSDRFDFNSDSRNDLFFTNDTTHGLAVWQLNGSQVLANPQIGLVNTAIGYQVFGSGDFNGDDQTDFLFFNSTTGGVAIWQMNGTQVVANPQIGFAPSGSHLQATGDFDGDNKTDLLFINDTTHAATVWSMNGTQIVNNAQIGIINANGGWHFERTADFNGDSKSDLLFLNDMNGGVAVWQMNGISVEANPQVGTMPTGSHFEASGDFNGDSKADLLFIDDTTHAATI